jgi:hypothetical protein
MMSREHRVRSARLAFCDGQSNQLCRTFFLLQFSGLGLPGEDAGVPDSDLYERLRWAR